MTLRVKIVGAAHPHRGEYGRLTGEIIRLVTGSQMALVALEHCQHGGAACYVSPGDVREVDAEDQFVARRRRRPVAKTIAKGRA